MTTTPAQRLEASIRLGVAAEEDWDGPSIKPGALTDDQISWLASWMAGDGCDKPPKPWEIEPVMVARVFNPLNEEPAEVIAQALTEVLDRLGYVAGCSVTPSLFGGYTVKAAARRKYPSELSDPADTVEP